MKLKANPSSSRSVSKEDRAYYRSIGVKYPAFKQCSRRHKKMLKKLEVVGYRCPTNGRMEARWKRQYLEAFEEPTFAVGYSKVPQPTSQNG